MVHSYLESIKEKEDFLSYFEQSYIEVVGGRQRTRLQLIFAIANWKKYQDIVNDVELTNNKMEGFNSAKPAVCQGRLPSTLCWRAFC
jgi:hypothetical protein